MQNAGLDEAQAESRLPGETSITSEMQVTPPLWQKAKTKTQVTDLLLSEWIDSYHMWIYK